MLLRISLHRTTSKKENPLSNKQANHPKLNFFYNAILKARSTEELEKIGHAIDSISFSAEEMKLLTTVAENREFKKAKDSDKTKTKSLQYRFSRDRQGRLIKHTVKVGGGILSKAVKHEVVKSAPRKTYAGLQFIFDPNAKPPSPGHAKYGSVDATPIHGNNVLGTEPVKSKPVKSKQDKSNRKRPTRAESNEF